jgi:hypothetical protein
VFKFKKKQAIADQKEKAKQRHPASINATTKKEDK